MALGCAPDSVSAISHIKSRIVIREALAAWDTRESSHIGCFQCEQGDTVSGKFENLAAISGSANWLIMDSLTHELVAAAAHCEHEPAALGTTLQKPVYRGLIKLAQPAGWRDDTANSSRGCSARSRHCRCPLPRLPATRFADVAMRLVSICPQCLLKTFATGCRNTLQYSKWRSQPAHLARAVCGFPYVLLIRAVPSFCSCVAGGR